MQSCAAGVCPVSAGSVPPRPAEYCIYKRAVRANPEMVSIPGLRNYTTTPARLIPAVESLYENFLMPPEIKRGRTWVFIRPRGGGEKIPLILVKPTLCLIRKIVNSTDLVYDSSFQCEPFVNSFSSRIHNPAALKLFVGIIPWQPVWPEVKKSILVRLELQRAVAVM